MCGITGFIAHQPIDTKDYYSAHMLIKHRGPDDEGFIVGADSELKSYRGNDTIQYFSAQPHIKTVEKAEVILGHRRLSILDLSERGHQPYCYGNLSLVYNGEIFNYIELRKELITLGYQFQTDSDTEVVLKAYHKWGKEAFNRFNGMWALAIYDASLKSLILCRDRFGIKPLFYSLHNGTLYFASELKFIKAFTEQKLSLNQRSAKTYLTNSKINHSADTFWNEVLELEPARYISFKEGRLSIERYWDCQPAENKYSDKDALEEFSHLFTESIKLRMRSDVEVGSLLSGGLDSTTIVCTLKKLGLISGNDFKSFSAVFDEQEFSEKSYIDETIVQTGIDSHFIWPKPENLDGYLDTILHHIESPFRSLAVYSQYLIYEHIKKSSNVKVLLNGQGADELFSGYTKHYLPHIFALAKSGKWTNAKNEFNLLSKNRKIKPSTLLKDIIIHTYKRPFTNLNKVGYNEITSTPLREYLTYDDRNSMAFGLETRVPFLDYKLVEFAMQLPSNYKINNFTNKKIVRDYAKNIIPSSVLNRTDKMGFVSPQEKWQENELEYILKVNDNNNTWTEDWRHYCLSKWISNNHI